MKVRMRIPPKMRRHKSSGRFKQIIIQAAWTGRTGTCRLFCGKILENRDFDHFHT